MQHRPKLFYTTESAPCPYLPNRMERKVLTNLSGPQATVLYDRLSQAGFRRSHTIVYAPACAHCQACTPIRIPVNLFQMSRTHHRILKRHKNIIATICSPIATEEQFILFQEYQKNRHGNSDMAQMSWEDYSALVENTPVDTIIVEFRLLDDQSLICVSLVDVMSDGLSAIYTFYSSEKPSNSWGTFSILWLIKQTQKYNKPYLYLGYYVPGSEKMAYKTNFQPAEVFINGHWQYYKVTPNEANSS